MRWHKCTIPIYILTIFGLGEILNFSSTVSMLPFFLAGLLLHVHKKKISSHRYWVVVCCLLIFASMFIVWDGNEYNIYQNPFEHSGGYKSFIIRTIIGLSGSVAVLWAIKALSPRFKGSRVAIYAYRLGSMTLGIYCAQVILAEGLLKSTAIRIHELLSFLPENFHHIAYDYVITLAAATFTVLFCVFVIKFLQRFKFTRIIFLGIEY